MKYIIAVLALAAAICANAKEDILSIELNDGTFTTIRVADIKEMTFTEDRSIAGAYTGTNSVSVGGMYTYTADITATVTENADGTINLSWPEYHLSNTIMGDLTLGAYTIKDIAWDADRNAYYRDYSDDGLTQHLIAVKDGTTTMDKDYTLGKTSSVTVTFGDDGTLKIINPFKLGAMPFPLSASFTGKK